MVSRIGHVGLRVTDLQRSVAFAEQVLGLRESERDGATAYLTCNARHHELVLIEDERPGCDHLAFEVFDAAALHALRVTLHERGIPVLDEPLERGVADAVRFLAPGGFVFEVFHGMSTDEPAHYETAGVRPVKFEHITVKSSNKDELERFVIEVLGLRLSDRAADQISWLRASDEHHGMSIIRADADQLQHYAWQVEGWDAFRRAGDCLMRHGRTFLWGPGHHGIGDNYFCYFEDADGAIVEYSAGIQRIENEAAYTPRTWPDEPLSVNRWGNPAPPAEFLEGGVPLVHPAIAVAQR
jgi:catechol 2,3-dioxygenase-like lactoylglutathione lyase family enzyme